MPENQLKEIADNADMIIRNYIKSVVISCTILNIALSKPCMFTQAIPN